MMKFLTIAADHAIQTDALRGQVMFHSITSVKVGYQELQAAARRVYTATSQVRKRVLSLAWSHSSDHDMVTV